MAGFLPVDVVDTTFNHLYVLIVDENRACNSGRHTEEENPAGALHD